MDKSQSPVVFPSFTQELAHLEKRVVAQVMELPISAVFEKPFEFGNRLAMSPKFREH
jgi:hypothetical protein